MSPGSMIKELRLKKGITQEELGDILGVKKAAIQKYESGQIQNLKTDTIKKLCEYFKVTPARFIFENYSEYVESLKKEVKVIEAVELLFGKEAVELLEYHVKLNDTAKQKVIDYAFDLSNIDYCKCNPEK